jgi:hypothetical protein
MTLTRLVVLLVVLAPAWLGPAMSPLVAALGGAPEHHCLCGMKRGECGCPECEALEHARAHDEDGMPGIRATCDSDGIAPAAHPPVTFVPNMRLAISPAIDAPTTAPARSNDPIDLHREKPPTPPPRQPRA